MEKDLRMQLRWGSATPVPILVLRHDVQLTADERERMLEGISRKDHTKIRQILIAASVRIERGEALLASLGWRP